MESRILKQDIEKFCNALDMDYQVDFVKKYADIGDSELYGGKHCGSDAEHAGSLFIAEQLKKLGVPKVELIPCNTARYQFEDAELKIVGDDRIIKPYGYVSPGTDKNGIKAQIIDVGKSTKKDYEGVDVSGKIVLLAAMGTLEGGNLAGQMEEAVDHGAAAVVIYAVEDVLNEDTIRVQPPNIISPVPIVGICGKDAEYLKEKTAAGKVVVNLTVKADFDPNEGITYNVVGEIPGRFSDEMIIYTAHLDHYFRCLQDNISTCSTLLGIVKAILASGYKPNRSMVFAFHGSHETGGQDTRYPYIFGSYKLANEDRKEWSGKAVMNINFEYTALSQKKMQMLAYMGSNRTVKEYWHYSPELVGGFRKKVKDAPQEEYYMMSWSDSISYLNAGIPTVTNDPITEQLYKGEGPYVGRDHSNYDNWEVFDIKALEDNGRMYGALGLFVDSLPYMIMDLAEQTDRVRNEINTAALTSFGIESDAYMKAVDEMEEQSRRVIDIALKKNEEYVEAFEKGLTDEEISAWFKAGKEFNGKMLKAYKVIAGRLDKINASDFLALATVKYAQNAELLKGALECLKNGDGDKAFDEYLALLDLSLSSWYFDESVVEHMRKQICAPEYRDRRTWAAGREMNVFTYYDLIQAYKEESGIENSEYIKTIEKIKQAIEREISYIPAAMENEESVYNEVGDILREI